MQAEEFLRHLFDVAVAAAAPDVLMARHLPPQPKGRVVVVGAGKASASMAAIFEDLWARERGTAISGIVVTRYGYDVPCHSIEIVQAAHPVPDEASVIAATRILEAVRDLGPDDLVVALISGGGSSLLTAPVEGVSLGDVQATHQLLLRAGVPIGAMNAVRKHLSVIAGGRLAVACHPAKIVSFIVSDVPGDDLATIASGPTIGDPSTFADARAVISAYGLDVPLSVASHLARGVNETIKPDDTRLRGHEHFIVASAQTSLRAAAEAARAQGIMPLILGDALEGEARELGVVMAGIARQCALYDQPAQRPCVLLSGGETHVTVRGDGRGGRNVEFLLAMAIKLAGAQNIYALACDTDGVDGLEEVAGAWCGPDVLLRARAAGLDAQDFLNRNDAHRFFAHLNTQIITGPTRTNVNDFRAVLVV